MSSAAARTRGRQSIHSVDLHLQCPPNWFWRDVLAPFLVTRVALSLVGLKASAGN